jgi:hypothetical protein
MASVEVCASPSQFCGISLRRRATATGPVVNVRRKLVALTSAPINRLTSVLFPVPVPPMITVIAGAFGETRK